MNVFKVNAIDKCLTSYKQWSIISKIQKSVKTEQIRKKNIFTAHKKKQLNNTYDNIYLYYGMNACGF